MARRFPPPLLGVPISADRYRTLVDVFDEVDDKRLPWSEFVTRCRERYRNPETGDAYSESYLRRVLLTCETIGVVDREDDTVSLSPPATAWLAGAVEFDQFLWRAIKRSWILTNDFPIGIEGLRAVHDVVVTLERDEGINGIARGAIEDYLTDERDYEFNENGIRGYPRLLVQLGALREEKEGYHVGKRPERYKSWFRDADIFGNLERRLRREGAHVTPPDDRVKRDMAKYYMYRESGGLGKETRWYETLWKDYLDEKARAGDSTEARLLKSDKYRDVRSKRQDVFATVRDTYAAFDSDDLRGLSFDVLERMRNADSLAEAQRIKIAAGSGITRLDLERLTSAGRSEYTFPTDFELYGWQRNAVDQWFAQTEVSEAQSGIAQVVTGAGKTVMALDVIRRWLDANPDGVVTIVVPTKVLMHQWLTELSSKLNVPVDEIGWAGGGHKDSFSDGRRVLVSIVNSAVKDGYLRDELRAVDDPEHLLVADECHRYTGDVFSNIFDYPRTASLGLSATPLSQTVHEPVTREALDEREFELTEDDELLLRELGSIYYTLTYGEGLERGLIPRFSINYVGFDLTDAERQTYDTLSRKVSKALEDIRERHGYRLDSMGGDFHQNLQRLLQRDDLTTPEIADYFEYTSERRELVNNAATRQAITLALLERALKNEDKTIVFQERIEQLEQMVAPLERRQNERRDLYEMYPALKRADQGLEDLFSRASYKPVMYHSGHSRSVWNDFAMEWFRDEGFANVMLSVKALVEGVDVPSADLGIVRVSSSSVRQRIQTLGRILRTGGDTTRHSRLYVLYARDTVDTNIFEKHDWSSELANAEINHQIWETGEDALDGELRVATEEEIPTERSWEVPEVPDVSELDRGDSYSGPRNGYRISVGADGRPFEPKRNSRRYIATDTVRDAAEFVHDRKGGGTIIVNEANHMLTQLPDEGLVFVGVLEGGTESLEYGEDEGRLSGDAPSSLEDIF